MKTMPKKPGQNSGGNQKQPMPGGQANRDQAGANRDRDMDRNRDDNRDDRNRDDRNRDNRR